MKPMVIAAAVAAILVIVGGAYVGLNSVSPPISPCAGSGTIQVVAGENFWGSLVAQLGGTHANVTSIVSDPNTDPHSYESSVSAARAFSNACFVIINGANYDVWASNLITAAGSTHQTVLDVQQALGQPVEANPHFWYSPVFVNATVKAMYNDLVKIDPADSAYYRQQYGSLNSSLWTSFMEQEAMIKHQFSGVTVASTESIFLYMANATGLKVITPPQFMKAVSEGNDPSAQDIATFQNQLNGGNGTVHFLVYNVQTVTPLTQSLLTLAAKNQIPVVRISETIQPPDLTFLAWMQGQIAQLENALKAAPLGK
ncbi:MAG TPA: zinc ABC transporter substrate-binding protein [Nitrososphaerales archaeon]|nr:zinc ABC transporter substrate-binding protein [Nitrososphaerales archaeon]